MTFCIGLTGNIGCGKSTVAKIFSHLGAAVLSADDINKQLIQKGMPAYNKIIEHFGQSILDEQKELNKTALRTIIFNTPQEKIWMEALLHPLIRAKIQEELQEITAPYCIIEIPLLLNKQHYPYLNRILLIYSDETAQMERLTTRDQCTITEAQAIIANQPTLEKRFLLADDILKNNGSVKQLEQDVLQLHKKYIQGLL